MTTSPTAETEVLNQTIRLYDELAHETYTLLQLGLRALGRKQYKRRPAIAWVFRFGENARVEIRPGVRTNEEDRAWYARVPRDYAWHWTPLSQSNYQLTDRYRVDVILSREIGFGFTLDNNQGPLEARVVKHTRIATEANLEPALDLVRRILHDPVEAARGNTSHCAFCRKGLTDPESVARGYGPDCADRYGLLKRVVPLINKDKNNPEPQETPDQ